LVLAFSVFFAEIPSNHENKFTRIFQNLDSKINATTELAKIDPIKDLRFPEKF